MLEQVDAHLLEEASEIGCTPLAQVASRLQGLRPEQVAQRSQELFDIAISQEVAQHPQRFNGMHERGIAHIRRRMTPRNARVTRRTAYYAGVAAIFQDLMPSARMIADEVLRKAGGGGSVIFSQEQVAAMAFNAAFKTLQRVNNNGAGGLALL